jgi:hypothetical protein
MPPPRKSRWEPRTDLHVPGAPELLAQARAELAPILYHPGDIASLGFTDLTASWG